MTSADEISNIRTQVRLLTTDLRVFNRVARTAKLSANDVLIILQSLGLPPEIARAVSWMQTATAVANTLRITIKLLYAEMGPPGWVLLVLGAIASAGVMAAAEMEARRPQY